MGPKARPMHLEGIEVKALCDLRKENIERAERILRESGRPEAENYSEEGMWCRMCECKEIDLIYICTDWLTHTEIAVYALQQGRHVALEVPAAMNVADCWRLVDTAEETRRHCMMLENCCYDAFALTATCVYLRERLFRRFVFAKHVEAFVGLCQCHGTSLLETPANHRKLREREIAPHDICRKNGYEQRINRKRRPLGQEHAAGTHAEEQQCGESDVT